MIAAGRPLLLRGDARTRGVAQELSEPGRRDAVHRAIRERLAQAAPLMAGTETIMQGMLKAAARWTPMALDEACGVAQGWGLSETELLNFLHLPVLLDRAEAAACGPTDGCSAWVAPDTEDRLWLGKNRDYRGEHAALQRVFLHRDPALPGGGMLCVGSIGAPGAFSSGINAAGLALVDTQVTTADHGPGVVRYFLMTELLSRCRDVEAALDMIRRVPHAGGGCLLLADAEGRAAAVELGASRVSVERCDPGGHLARTNHHLHDDLAPYLLERPGEPMERSSRGRLATLRSVLARSAPLSIPLVWARAVMGSHDAEPGGNGKPVFATGLCRHGQDGDALTISCTLIVPREPALYFCAGQPCTGEWLRHGF